MKKTTKKNRKPSQSKAAKNLHLHPDQIGTVRGGITVSKANDLASTSLPIGAADGKVVKIRQLRNKRMKKTEPVHGRKRKKGETT